MSTCPKCKLVNPPDAVRCDCGYDFASGQVERSYIQTKAAHDHSFTFGFVYAYLCFFGCLVAGVFIALVFSGVSQSGDWQASAPKLIAFTLMFIMWLITGIAILRRRKYAITLSYIGAAFALVGILARGIVPLDVILAIPTFAIVFYLRKRSDMLT